MKKIKLVLLIILSIISISLFSCENEVPNVEDKYEEIVYNWNHDFSECTAIKVCITDELKTVTETVKSTSSKVDPTCTESGYITYSAIFTNSEFVNQTKEVTIDALGHTINILPAVDPTCKTLGLTEGQQCKICGTILVAQEEVAKKEHTVVIDEAKASTCENTGLTEGKHCSICDEVIVAQEIVAKKEHTIVIDEAKAPTCEETGLTEGKHCSICNEVIVAQEVVSALGHEYNMDEYEHIESVGHAHKCVRCDEYDELVGHVSSGEATETEAEVCTLCGYIINPELGHIVHTPKDNYVFDDTDHWFECTGCNLVVIDRNSHNFDNQCDTTCDTCGYTRTITHNEIILDYVAPTCDDTGLTEGKKCSVCNEIIINQQQIEALGHDYDIRYSWNDDYSKCSATATCLNDSSHIITEEVQSTFVSGEVLLGLASQNGYNAKFDNVLFSEQSTNEEYVTDDIEYYELVPENGIGLSYSYFEDYKLLTEIFYDIYNGKTTIFNYEYEDGALVSITIIIEEYDVYHKNVIYYNYSSEKNEAIAYKLNVNGTEMDYDDSIVSFYDNGIIKSKIIVSDGTSEIRYDEYGRKVYISSADGMIVENEYLNNKVNSKLNFNDMFEVYYKGTYDGLLLKEVVCDLEVKLFTIDINYENKCLKSLSSNSYFIESEEKIPEFIINHEFEDNKFTYNKYKIYNEGYISDNHSFEYTYSNDRISSWTYKEYDENDDFIYAESEQYKFDQYGNIIELICLGFDSNNICDYKRIDEYTFDSLNQILDKKVTHYLDEETIEYIEEYEYKYDPLGNLVEEINTIYDSTGNITSKVGHLYAYDERENRLYTATLKYTSENSFVFECEETNQYDEDDNQIYSCMISYDSLGNVFNKTIYQWKYDEDGNSYYFSYEEYNASNELICKTISENDYVVYSLSYTFISENEYSYSIFEHEYDDDYELLNTKYTFERYVNNEIVEKTIEINNLTVYQYYISEDEYGNLYINVNEYKYMENLCIYSSSIVYDSEEKIIDKCVLRYDEVGNITYNYYMSIENEVKCYIICVYEYNDENYNTKYEKTIYEYATNNLISKSVKTTDYDEYYNETIVWTYYNELGIVIETNTSYNSNLIYKLYYSYDGDVITSKIIEENEYNEEGICVKWSTSVYDTNDVLISKTENDKLIYLISEWQDSFGNNCKYIQETEYYKDLITKEKTTYYDVNGNVDNVVESKALFDENDANIYSETIYYDANLAIINKYVCENEFDGLELIKSTSTQYDKDGTIIYKEVILNEVTIYKLTTIYNGDIIESVYITEWNELGVIIYSSATTYDENGRISFVSECDYENGLLINNLYTFYKSDETIDYKTETIYEYDSSENCVKETNITYNALGIFTQKIVTENEYNETNERIKYTSSTYDETNKLINKYTYAGDVMLYSYTIDKYELGAYTITENSYRNDATLISSLYEYYNELGKKTLKTYQENDEFNNLISYLNIEYDENEEIMYKHITEYSYDNNNLVNSSYTKYDGNDIILETGITEIDQDGNSTTTNTTYRAENIIEFVDIYENKLNTYNCTYYYDENNNLTHYVKKTYEYDNEKKIIEYMKEYNANDELYLEEETNYVENGININHIEYGDDFKTIKYLEFDLDNNCHTTITVYDYSDVLYRKEIKYNDDMLYCYVLMNTEEVFAVISNYTYNEEYLLIMESTISIDEDDNELSKETKEYTYNENDKIIKYINIVYKLGIVESKIISDYEYDNFGNVILDTTFNYDGNDNITNKYVTINEFDENNNHKYYSYTIYYGNLNPQYNLTETYENGELISSIQTNYDEEGNIIE